MANPAQRINIIGVQVNGALLDVKSLGLFELGGKVREAEIGDQGVFFSARTSPFRLNAEIYITTDTNIEAMRDWEDVTLILTADTGQTWTVANCFVERAGAINRESGTVEIVFAGPEARPVN